MPPGLGEMGVKWPGRRQKIPPAQGAGGQKGRGSRLAKPAVGDGAGAEPEVPRHPLPHPADDLAHGEGGGPGALTRKLCDAAVTLEMAPGQATGVDSYNVSVAAGILCYDVMRRRIAKK